MVFDFMKDSRHDKYEMIEQCHPFLPVLVNDTCYARLPGDQFEDLIVSTVKQNNLAAKINKN
jgi:hypothetical protein